MQFFTYKYAGEIHESGAEHFADRGCVGYRVAMGDGLTMIIAQAGMRAAQNKIVWVQFHGPGEIVYAHELVQAIGEGIEVIFFN
jgi:hypothetical protein